MLANIVVVLMMTMFYVDGQGTTAQCPQQPLMVNGMNLCGEGQVYDATQQLCCFTNTNTNTNTQTTQEYCETPLIVNGMSICPPTHPLNQAKGQCCGSTPINGNSANGNCVDLSITGRPNDCVQNANLCNNTVYYDLMTQQCPKTCNRCSASTSTQNGNAIPGCVDGTNAKGVSECPDNKAKCDLPLWREFMTKECPATCNRCNTNPVPVIPPSGGATTTSTTTTTTTTTVPPGR
ncbi:unnamed protein product [Bursaphelenchus okinawaensis]|uniref:ShKT domain-containing protein n=1 Tax=Bursaphelenchus okinawaensis TaxID=465554 RepID=A0A811L777_9BILA|nr:unnamed protein product [Bursaphelenchus okinawaensis]CAG9118106.1 unnamed protein product [Bursaphelenchus okinawaensis]